MSHAHANDHAAPDDDSQNELERLLLEGVSLDDSRAPVYRARLHNQDTGDDVEDQIIAPTTTGDLQGALGLFAEATSDLATAGVELGLGRHFACVDFCNQAVEKAAQAVSLLRYGRRSMYNHDLRELGAAVDAPLEIQEAMAMLTPFHPEAFYADTPPEEADEVVSAEQAESYRQHARHVLRWARNIVLHT